MFTTPVYTLAIRYDAIRQLAGHVKEQTISDEKINDIASRKDSKIFKLTGKYDYTDESKDTPMVIDASNCLAAIEILRSFGTSQNAQIANDLKDKVDEIIKDINGDSTLQNIPDVTKSQGFNLSNRGTFI